MPSSSKNILKAIRQLMANNTLDNARALAEAAGLTIRPAMDLKTFSIESFIENKHAAKNMRLGNSSRIASTIKPMRWKEIARIEDTLDNAKSLFNKFNSQSKLRLVETYTGDVISTKNNQFDSVNHHPDFVENSHGSINFGEITPLQSGIIGRQAGKIRLPIGEHRQNGTGYGLVHIEAKHGTQIRGAGFVSVEKFVESVVGNFEQIWKATVGQLALMAIDKYKHVVFIQLAPAIDGDYYQINTAFPVSRDYFEKKEKSGWNLLWDRSEPISKVTGQQLSAYAATPDAKSSQANPIARGQGNYILADNQKVSKHKDTFDSIANNDPKEIIAAIRKLMANNTPENARALAEAAGLSIEKPTEPKSKTAETVERLLSSPILKAANLLTGKETIDEAKKQGALFYKELIANPIASPALGDDITFDQRGWDYITNEGYAKQFDPKKKRSDKEVMQRISLLPKAKEVIANAASIEGEPRTEHGSTRFALLGRFDDGEAIRVILERRDGEEHYFLSVFDLERESKQLRKSSLPTSTLSGAPSVQGKATDASDSSNIPQLQTKTITIKVPVAANSLIQYAGKAYGDLSQLTESDFLKVWKYIIAANYMLRNSINVSDAKNSNRHVLGQSGKAELVKLVNDELLRRGLDKKYTLFVERKEQPQFDDIGGFNFEPMVSVDATMQAIKKLMAENTLDNARYLAMIAGLKLKEDEPSQDLDMFGEPINQDFDLFGDPIQDGEESPVEELPRLAVVELPLSKLTLSDDVPQFKSGADGESGVVEALGGKFDRTGVAPIQVWERTDGRLEIISGRHRTDLARRSGEKTIPAQVHKESEGFTAKQAMMLDAELNIRDGQGKVKDYVDYFTHSEISEEEADRRGLIARSIGQRAFTIASKGSEELKTLHRNEIISDQAAADIASIAPNNGAMQAVGLRVLQEHKPLNNALNTIRAVMALTREKGQEPDTFDLFGFDDSALKEAEAMARIASRKQRQIAEQLNAIKGAVKNPKLAAKHGVVVENEADALAKVQAMTAQKARWDNWSSHADLLAEVREELNDKFDSLLDDEDDYYWLCQEELAL